MSDKDIFDKTGNSTGPGSSDEPAQESKITLDSILREYDAKRFAEEKKKSEKDDKSGISDAFRQELENLSDGISVNEKKTEYDDSDMKIAQSYADKHDDGIDLEKELAKLGENNSGDSDKAEEKSDLQEDRKLNIMSEISRHFERQMPDTAQDSNEVSDDGTAVPELPDTEKEQVDVNSEKSDETPEDSEQNKPQHRKHISIDENVLKKAFSEDGYDIFSGASKRSRRKKRKKYDDYYGDTPEDIAAEEAGEYNVDVGDTEAYRGVRGRYDENGERIERDSLFFTPKYEYTKDSDPSEIMFDLKVRLLGSCFALIMVFILMLSSFYTEVAPSLGLPHFKVFEPGKTGIIFLLFDLQLLFAAVIIKLNSVCKGAAGLFSGIPTAESVGFVSVIAATIHTVSLAVADPSGNRMVPVCSVACFSILILALKDFFHARIEYMSFRIVSSDSEKYAFKDLSAAAEKTPDEISKFVPEGSTVLDIRKIKFYDRFFERNANPAPADHNTSAIIFVALGVALIASAIYCIVNKEPVYTAFCSFSTIVLASVQACMLICTSLPEFAFADRASKRKCALVGHDICEEFSNVSVVSFKDTEVFSPKEIKVTNIRTYGDTRIDSVIVTMARIFGKIGGPLSSVFTNSISGISFENDGMKIVDVAPDGLWLKIDGDNIYVGTASYMAENNFDILPDAADDSFRQTNGGILYLASSERVLAKFYIKYTLNPGFESVLRTLYTQGICARIKTLDPCINNDFIRASLRRPECLFSVVKTAEAGEMEKEEESLSSGIVSISGESSLIHSFLLVKKMRGVIRINNCIKIFAFIISLALSVFALLGGSLILPAAVILLIQIFWLIPVFITTKLSSGR